MPILEAAGVILAGVTLLLDRLDKRRHKDKERLDVQAALLELDSLLTMWWEQAAATNLAVRAWIKAGMPEDLARTLTGEYLLPQSLLLADVHELLGIRSERRAGGRGSYQSHGHQETLYRTLSAYAPELIAALDEATMIRATQLDRMIPEIRSRAAAKQGSIEQYLGELDQAQERLADAEDAVRRFLMEAYPLTASRASMSDRGRLEVNEDEKDAVDRETARH